MCGDNRCKCCTLNRIWYLRKFPNFLNSDLVLPCHEIILRVTQLAWQGTEMVPRPLASPCTGTAISPAWQSCKCSWPLCHAARRSFLALSMLVPGLGTAVHWVVLQDFEPPGLHARFQWEVRVLSLAALLLPQFAGTVGARWHCHVLCLGELSACVL